MKIQTFLIFCRDDGYCPHYLEFIRFALLLSKLHPNMFCTPSPTRTETQLRMAPKATDYTNSSNGVSYLKH